MATDYPVRVSSKAFFVGLIVGAVIAKFIEWYL